MVDRMTPPSPLVGTGMTSPRTRTRMIERMRDSGIQDERVLNAIADLPRHLFVENALAHRAYDDDALPIGHGQTISQPQTVGRMTELLLNAPNAPRKILEIGTGCGYQTAVLVKLFGEVYSMERIAALLDKARAHLRAVKLVRARLVHGDGHLGLPECAPFDGIIMTAAATHIPEALLDQLVVGGRMILPIGTQEQHLWMLDKHASGIEKTQLDPVRFVPLLPGAI